MNLNRSFNIKMSCLKYLILLSALLVYSGSYSVGWYFDGMPVRQMFEEMDGVVPIKNFLSITGASYIGYMGWFSFYINQYLHGNRLWEFHLVNITIHAVNALLIYLIIVNIIASPYYKNGREDCSGYDLYAFYAGLLFAVHPITTQSVTYLYQRFTSLATLFYLASFYFYTLFRLKDNDARTVKSGAVLFYITSFLCANLGLYTKYHPVTLPLMLFLFELYFFSYRDQKGRWKRIFIYISPFFLAVFFRYIIFDIYITGFHTTIPEGIIEKNPQAAPFFYISRLTYLFTEFRVIITYIRLLLFPVNQNVLYDYPYAASFFDLPTVISFSFLSAFLYAGLRAFRSSRIISFFVLWFFVNIAVTSSVIPERQVIFEHRLYLPGIGILAALSICAVKIYLKMIKDGHRTKHIFLACLTLVIAFQSVSLVKRNCLWMDETALIEDIVKKAPKNVLALSQLGFIYLNSGREKIGEDLLLKALARHPAFELTLTGLCGYYIRKGRLDDAYAILKKAAVFFPNRPYIEDRLNYVQFLKDKGESI